MRARHGEHHALGHGLALHPQLGVDAGHDDVESGEQVVVAVERAVFEDVDLDAGEDPERREVGVQPVEHVELLQKSLAREAVRDRQAGRVVGQHHVLVSELDRGASHLLDGRSAVGPVRVAVAVAAQRGAERGTLG